MNHRSTLLAILTAAFMTATAATAASAQATPDPSDPAFYTSHVAPIFKAKCASCHAGAHHHGGFSINTKASVMKGGEDGPVIVPGHPEQSMLVKLIHQTNLKKGEKPMPPKGKLSDDNIHAIEQWIQAGAAMPGQ